MLKPAVLNSDAPHGAWSCRGCDVWDTICAAANGDVPRLEHLLARDPNLYRAEYWYTQPIHFAVREGHAEPIPTVTLIHREVPRLPPEPPSRGRSCLPPAERWILMI